jgi:hypothetical protein
MIRLPERSSPAVILTEQAPIRQRLEGIDDNVDEHLLQLLDVASDGWQALRQSQGQAITFLADARIEQSQDGLEDFRDVGEFVHMPVILLTQVLQIANDFLNPPGVFADVSHAA